MFLLNLQKYLAVLSAFALLTQLLAPGLAMANGLTPSFICNPAGQISAEMQAGIDELKAALGIEEGELDAAMDCEDCIASVHALLAADCEGAVPVNWTASSVDPVSLNFVWATPRGPPLGSRAPPS